MSNDFIKSDLSIHDKFNIENKISFFLEKNKNNNEFVVEHYFFVPGNLGIDETTFDKKRFYRRIKRYLRFKTPNVNLKDILNNNKRSPFLRLMEVLTDCFVNGIYSEEDHRLKYEIKLCGSIIRTSLRDHVVFIRKNLENSHNVIQLFDEFVAACGIIKKKIEEIRQICLVPSISQEFQDHLNWFEESSLVYINEYSNILMSYLKKYKGNLEGDFWEKSEKILIDEISENIRIVEELTGIKAPEDKKSKEVYLYRKRILKKYISSALYLNLQVSTHISKIKHGLYALAAGIAMLLSVIGVYYFQNKFKNFSFPLIASLVIIYMFKDRIKAIFQNIFKSLITKYVCDNKINIFMTKNSTPVGDLKEYFKYVDVSDIPSEIRSYWKKRKFDSLYKVLVGESIFLYKKKLNLMPMHIQNIYPEINAVNDIIRMNIKDFFNYMDNPKSRIFVMKGEDYDWEDTERYYYIHICTLLKYKDFTHKKFYRITLNRSGLKKISEIF